MLLSRDTLLRDEELLFSDYEFINEKKVEARSRGTKVKAELVLQCDLIPDTDEAEQRLYYSTKIRGV
jgi:hypothetical protein